MYFKDIATLKYIVEGVDTEGFPTETEVSYPVFVDKSYTLRSEFYQANSSGLSATVAFTVRTEDWEATRHVVNSKEVYATEIEYNGATFTIIRADDKKSIGMVDIICG